MDAIGTMACLHINLTQLNRSPSNTVTRLIRRAKMAEDASRSSFTVPNVLSGLCFMPLWEAWIMSFLNESPRGCAVIGFAQCLIK
jgi:hypothetical protein